MIELPEPVCVNTGDQGSVYRTIETFFDEVENFLEPKPLWRRSYIERRLGELVKPRGIDKAESDDKMHMLLYYAEVVAVVTETRNDANCIQFGFFIRDLEKIFKETREKELNLQRRVLGEY